MKTHDVVATTGTYDKDGTKKYVSRNVGSIIETKHGLRMKLDATFNPAGCPAKTDDGFIWLALFAPRPKDTTETAAQMANRVFNEPTDDIPF